MTDPAAPLNWLQLFSAALGGGVTVKLVDILYQEIRRRSERSQSAATFLDKHLDPLLKAADELAGKLHSLATEDFESLVGRSLTLKPLNDNDFGSLLYLFSRFWAQIEIIRQEGLSIAISADPRGARLQAFLASLESRKVRLVDRISQRAIGELLMDAEADPPKTIGYVRFVRAVEGVGDAERWITPLAQVLLSLQHRAHRQQLLQYGIVVQALADTLDARRAVTRLRPGYPTKLSQRTRRHLRYRVFGVYLKFVADRERYLSPPKKG
ncbi:MAG TPA: hypothetical protein VD846_05290 [Allosphingosinicella sp.]|nr:hypothetical protein [Allosphingosinicella sp.]